VTASLKDQWTDGPVYVVIGAGSNGMGLTGDEAWLDNFVVETGAVPE